tara:strand:+ start:668 stop:856 length:189 start_codon:yes stop_codon:yes gene_type:complete
MAVVEKQGGKVEHVIMVYGRGDKVPENAIVVNATSRSKEAWSKGLRYGLVNLEKTCRSNSNS